MYIYIYMICITGSRVIIIHVTSNSSPWYLGPRGISGRHGGPQGVPGGSPVGNRGPFCGPSSVVFPASERPKTKHAVTKE